MDKMKKKIPPLRFPGFAGEWKKVKVHDFAPLQRGFDLPISEIKNGNYPVVFSNGILKTHNIYKVKAPGVVTGRSGTIGKVTFVEKDFWPHNTSLWVTDFKDNHPKFVYYFYDKFKLDRFGTGSGVPTLNRNDVHIQKIRIPHNPEQQKIAAFLTAVDDKINRLTRKKTLLEQYKKGVMQKIFSQEIRFPEFEGEWEPKTIREIGDLLGGGTPDTSNKKFWLGTIPWISSSDLCENNVFEINFSKHINETAIAKSATKLIPSKSILIVSRVGVGKVAVNKKALCTSQDFTNLVAYEDCHIFLAYLIKTKTKKLLKFNQGTSIKGFVKSDFEQLKLFLPTLPEQQKIADFFTGIDKKIELVNSQLEKTKQWKSGLLQQMFV